MEKRSNTHGHVLTFACLFPTMSWNSSSTSVVGFYYDCSTGPTGHPLSPARGGDVRAGRDATRYRRWGFIGGVLCAVYTAVAVTYLLVYTAVAVTYLLVTACMVPGTFATAAEDRTCMCTKYFCKLACNLQPERTWYDVPGICEALPTACSRSYNGSIPHWTAETPF